MSIEIKRSIKPVEYYEAIQFLEKRLENVINKGEKELLWFLEHNTIYTAGKNFKKTDVLDNKINLIKTSRGGKITCHSPGQLVCYLVIDLSMISFSLKDVPAVKIVLCSRNQINSFAFLLITFSNLFSSWSIASL